jgi:hypothetical protein
MLDKKPTLLFLVIEIQILKKSNLHTQTTQWYVHVEENRV